jgi:hypothetical protein
MTLSIIHWLEDHLMTCPYKALSGLECPGCGMQRSFIELLKGNFGESFYLYPGLFPVMITILLTALHIKFKFRNGAGYIKYAFIFTVSVVMINYIVKFFI